MERGECRILLSISCVTPYHYPYPCRDPARFSQAVYESVIHLDSCREDYVFYLYNENGAVKASMFLRGRWERLTIDELVNRVISQLGERILIDPMTLAKWLETTGCRDEVINWSNEVLPRHVAYSHMEYGGETYIVYASPTCSVDTKRLIYNIINSISGKGKCSGLIRLLDECVANGSMTLLIDRPFRWDRFMILTTKDVSESRYLSMVVKQRQAGILNQLIKYSVTSETVKALVKYPSEIHRRDTIVKIIDVPIRVIYSKYMRHLIKPTILRTVASLIKSGTG